MSERPVTLDLAVTAGDCGLRDTATSRERRPASQGDVARFAEALVRDARGESQPAGALPDGPMALLSGVNRSAAMPNASTLAPLLQNMVTRLMVGDGSTSARSTRMTLSDDLLPGASVSVYEEAGAWVAEFHVADPSSFQTLAGAATDMAFRLAAELSRDAVWRVKTDPEDDSMTVEACAAAPAAGER